MALRVGLTGGIGSGKSAALSAFARCGAAAISLDDIAHELSRPGRPVYRAVLKAFGPAAAGPAGLNRAALAEKVFRSPAARRRLERASHPAILREMRRRLAACRKPVAVVDAPLLFEAGLASEFDLTLAVTAPKSMRLRRVMRRDGAGRAQVLRRMGAQFTDEKKRSLADAELPNVGSLAALKARAREFYRAMRLIANRSN